MKKFFTLIAAALCVAGVQAQEELVIFPASTVNGTDGFTPTEYVDDGYSTTTANTTLTIGVDGGANGYYDVKAQSVNLALTAFAQEVELEGEMKQRVVYISGKNNPKDGEPGSNSGSGYNHYGSSHNIPTTGTYYVIQPVVKGTISAGVVINADKTFYVLDVSETDTVEVSYVINDERNAVDEEGNPILDENDKNVKELYQVQAYPDEYFDLATKDRTAWRTAHPGAWMTVNPEGKGGIQVGAKVNGTVNFEAQAGHKYYLFTAGSKLGFFGYVFTPSDDTPDTDSSVIWENPAPETNGIVSWNGTYRFGLEEYDGANECIAHIAPETWAKMKTDPFYMQFSGDNYQIRVTNGWWSTQWLGADEDIAYWGAHSDLITDNGDGTYNLKVDFGAEPIDPVVETLDERHLLFTGSGYTPLKLFFADDVPTGIQSITTAKDNNGAIYNLAGQRVDASYKGIVIMNGKKFINK